MSIPNRSLPNRPSSLIVLGAGGLGREVAELALEIMDSNPLLGWKLCGFLDDKRTGTVALGGVNLPVMGTIASWAPSSSEVFVCGIGDPRTRERVTESIVRKGAQFVRLVHPRALVSRSATIRDGTVLFASAVVSAGADVGNHVLVNYFASVGHDSKVGDFSVVSGHSDITGSVSLGKGVLVGSQATIAPGLHVGDYARISMGSVVVASVLSGKTVFGNPARGIRL